MKKTISPTGLPGKEVYRGGKATQRWGGGGERPPLRGGGGGRMQSAP